MTPQPARPMLLVPADVLRPRRPDEHFAAEAQAARAAGHEVALVDHDALAAGDAARGVSRLSGAGPAAYRGWMLTAERYADFAAAAAERGVVLRTSAEQYRQAHELPGWYPALADRTPASVWTRGVDADDFRAAAAELGAGPAVVRDWTKSMKHHWDEAMFIPDLADTAAAWTVARRLAELRGADLVGGFVLRRFEPFTGAEVRTWWVDGECRLVTAHPDTPDDLPPDDLDVTTLRAAVAGLGLPFVTVDLARTTAGTAQDSAAQSGASQDGDPQGGDRPDGVWRVIELGDGQVSDRPASTPPDALLDAVLGHV